MRANVPIVCTGCNRFLRGRSAYIWHSCKTVSMPPSIPSPMVFFLSDSRAYADHQREATTRVEDSPRGDGVHAASAAYRA